MAEPSPAPALPSTADPIPYVPVSWMAVAAVSVAGLFVAILLALAVSAFVTKRPLVQAELLVFPAVGIVLSFAARRMIRNAEGTRTGDNLVNIAWWTCVIGGLGYAAYLLAIDFAIRRDARIELERWVEHLKSGDPERFNAAFLRTREPAVRSRIDPKDVEKIKGMFREEYIALEQLEITRLLKRNPDSCTFEPGAVKEWSYRPSGIECIYTGVLKCAEGKFPISMALRGVESPDAAGRQWVVVLAPKAITIARDQQSLTPYGWLMQLLEETGTVTGNQFIQSLRAGQWAIPYVYQTQMVDTLRHSPKYWEDAISSVNRRLALIGGVGAIEPYTPDYVAYSFPDQFYKAPGGREPTAEQKAQFKSIWETAGLQPAGTRLRNSADAYPTVTVTDHAVEVRIPCELPIPGQDTSFAARGRLVVVSTDPALLSELKQLKSSANPDAGSPFPSEELRRRPIKWRVVHVESDMVKVQMPREAGGPGSPGLPGG
jgi:hypothetical protein